MHRIHASLMCAAYQFFNEQNIIRCTPPLFCLSQPESFCAHKKSLLDFSFCFVFDFFYLFFFFFSAFHFCEHKNLNHIICWSIQQQITTTSLNTCDPWFFAWSDEIGVGEMSDILCGRVDMQRAHCSFILRYSNAVAVKKVFVRSLLAIYCYALTFWP